MSMDLLNIAYLYILRPVFTIVFNSLYRVKVTGAENLPKDKGFIIAANHTSFADGPVLAWSLRPRPVHWIVSKDIYIRWYFKPLMIISRSVPVNGSVESAEGILNRGKILGIFPGGGICCDRVMRKGHKGVAVLARLTGSCVVPTYIKADINFNKGLNILPRPFTPIEVTIGRPISFEKYPTRKIPLEILNGTVNDVINAINGLAKGRSTGRR